MFLGTYQNNRYDELEKVVNASMEVGLLGFDTAPSYGTEKMLGKALRKCLLRNKMKRESIFISDKIDAWQMQRYNGDVTKFVESTLKSMELDYLDVLFVHWPVPEYLDNTWSCFLKLQETGLVKHIGICNVRVRHLKEMRKRNIYPECIQIERHPLRTCDEEVEFCKSAGISLLAYSPLCRMHKNLCENAILKELSLKYNKTIAQVILRWHIDTGDSPVFMSKKVSRINSNVDIFDFQLLREEIELINGLNQNYKIFLESWGCPGF